MKIPQKYRDLFARAGWQASLGFISIISAPAAVEAIDSDVKAHLPVWVSIVVPSVAALLSAAKSFVGTKVGDPDSVTLNGPKDKEIRETAKAIVEGTAVPIPDATDQRGINIEHLTVQAPALDGAEIIAQVRSAADVFSVGTPPPVPSMFERLPESDPEAVLPQGEPATTFDTKLALAQILADQPPPPA